MIPGERYAKSAPEAGLNLMAELQQKARALECEVERRSLVEGALAERDRELSDFLENALEGLLKVGPDGTVFWINGAGLELLGCDQAQVVGRPLEDFHLDPGDARDSLRRLLAGETLHDYATVLRRNDGSVRHARIAANAHWDAGKLLHSRWFIRDVTHERLAESARAHLAAIVESSDDAIVSKTLEGIIRSWNRGAERLFGYTAEEAVGRPVTLIIPAERVHEEDEILARLRRGERIEHFETVRLAKSGRRIHVSLTISPIRNASGVIIGASKIARDISEQRASEQAQRRTIGELKILRRSPADLAAVVAAAQESARPLIEARGHTLVVRLPGEPIRLAADPVRLAQVLANLLINAAKYTDPGGRIELEASRDGGELVVAVRDNGIGISADMMPRVFTLFAQASPALERSEGGLGIGLALVRGLVELHGGTVSAHSRGAGQGSEFVLRLPIGVVGNEEDHDADEASEPACPGAKRLRLLVADDNRDSAATCAALLEASGHEVTIAHAGREALDLACRLEPDALLLDIGMPELNGYQLAQRIRGTGWGRRALLIAITGWGQEQDKRRALAAGFDEHLTKPIDPNGLEALLRRAVGWRSSNEE